MPDKIYVTWDEFHRDTISLCEKIKKFRSFNKIIAVSRGGLIPAGIIAYELGIRHNAVVNIISYEDDKRLDNARVFGLDQDVDENTLIVDDLSDTGRSISILRDLYPNAAYAAVYVKSQGEHAPDFYSSLKPDKWIVFPWD